MNPPIREQAFRVASETTYDAVVVGGGVTGAAIFREVGMRGYRALLIDKGDFSSGTSQASGMLVWGGLLYLRNLDIGTVARLSRARDSLLTSQPDDVHELPFRYLPLRSGGRSRLLVRGALHAY
jgi:glycerol-3-phosphate dehydrogenase